MRGKTYGFESFQENNPQKNSPQDTEAYARNVVRACEYTEAVEHLRCEGILNEQIESVHKKYRESLLQAEFLTEKDWEMLTVIELYSSELTVHSIETYQLVRSKLEDIFLTNESSVANSIVHENVSLDEFYRACILHDIGKTLIPESVLNYTLEPGDWYALRATSQDSAFEKNIRDYLGTEATEGNRHELILQLMNSERDPITSLPVSELLNEEQLEALRRRSLPTDVSLKEILSLHESASQNILAYEGFHTEALIAGQHHNYKNEEYRFPISSQTIGINADLAELLHLADGEQAMLSERSYKPAFSRIQAFSHLIKDAQRGAINKELTALWIQHDVEKGLVVPENGEDEVRLEEILRFVKAHAPHAHI